MMEKNYSVAKDETEIYLYVKREKERNMYEREKELTRNGNIL